MIVICEQCGKEINKKPSEIGIHTYCGIKCMGLWRKGNEEYKKTFIGRKTKPRKLNKYIVEGEIARVVMKENIEVIIDAEDVDKVKGYSWRINKNGYAITEFRESVNKTKRIQMHRLINNTPKDKVTDHINENKLDNRKTNLRSCTSSQNAMNISKSKGETSNTRGVSYSKRDKSWRTTICKEGIRISLGYYKTEEEAIKARHLAEMEIHGEFSPLLNSKVQLE